MALRFARNIWIAAAAVTVAVGCGGGGTSTSGGNSPDSVTREKVQEQYSLSVRSMAQSGIQTPGQAGIRNGIGIVRPGGQGGIAPMPMIGCFFRYAMAGGGPVRPLDAGAGSEPGEGGGGSPPGMREDFYYDEWLGLWVQITNEPTHFRFDFFTDEAKSQPAGFADSTWTGDPAVFPQTCDSTFEVHAGLLAGSSGSYVSTSDSPTSGSMRYSYHWSDGSGGQGESSWSDSGSRYRNETTLPSGEWFHDSGAFQADGSGDTSSEDSAGFKTSYHWNADGSGNGRLEGPARGLPAVLRWDAFGNGRITYADGTSEEFHWWWIYGDGVERPVEGGGGEPPPTRPL